MSATSRAENERVFLKRARGFAAAAAIAFAAALRIVGAQTAPHPIVVLVSIDGFRYDYFDRANLPNLKALAARGVRSQGLIPSFPSVTFPNHYTIVTGLVPDHHGIIANVMFDRLIGPDKFTMSSMTARDARWWGGEPIWKTAMKQGYKAAAMFWPGAEAVQPTYWRPFDDAMPDEDRVKQVLDWMQLPEGERPIFSTLYFSDLDNAGHDFGPNSREVLEAAAHVDESIGQLMRGMAALDLDSRTTYVIVSDHGMAEMSTDRVIFIDDYLSKDEIDVVEWSPNVEINPRGAVTAEALYQKLVNKHPALAVYKRDQLPKWMQFGANPRIPAVIGVAELGWLVTTHASFEAKMASGRRIEKGAHGYDPRYRELHGLFIAAGPPLRRGLLVPEFQNIHIYNLMCRVLSLTPAPNDGDFSQVASFFVK